jgi:hypothetical protein
MLTLYVYTYFAFLNHLYLTLSKYLPKFLACRFRWPWGVCGRSNAETVGSNLAEGMDVCCERCLLLGIGLCDGPITLPVESYQLCCVTVCDLETSRTRRPWSALGRSAIQKKLSDLY